VTVNFNNRGRPVNHNDVGQPACGNGTYGDFSGFDGFNANVAYPEIDAGTVTLGAGDFWMALDYLKLVRRG
jgi:hypothetical protein